MDEYRQHLPRQSGIGAASRDVREQSTRLMGIWATSSRYHLEDMLNFNQDEEVYAPSTVEEEFSLYTKELSARGTDMIAFWDVSRF